MGATAFTLLGEPSDKTLQHWIADKSLFDVAQKAVCNNREERYQSIGEFTVAWNYAKSI